MLIYGALSGLLYSIELLSKGKIIKMEEQQMAKTVNQVIRSHNNEKIKLTVGTDDNFIYLEGSKKSLKWLAEIIDAYAEQPFADDYWIQPKGAGNSYFTRKSTHGIYMLNTDLVKPKQKKQNKKVDKNHNQSSLPE